MLYLLGFLSCVIAVLFGAITGAAVILWYIFVR